MTDAVITDNPAQHRYEAHVDGVLAGFSAYRFKRDHIVFTHTEVDDAFAGEGVGAALAKGALDDIRARAEHDVVALCPFISAWIARHPQYQDLVAP